MPGDDLLPRAHYGAPARSPSPRRPEEVWPWLVQVGCLRAGWYADDLLDNLARPSARHDLPELQDLEVGRWLPMAPDPDGDDRVRRRLLRGTALAAVAHPDSTWAWQLVPLPDGRTRLVTRLHVVYDWRREHRPACLLMEFGDWPMMRRMLRGIRERAEDDTCGGCGQETQRHDHSSGRQPAAGRRRQPRRGRSARSGSAAVVAPGPVRGPGLCDSAGRG